jgi:hypothetical protein
MTKLNGQCLPLIPDYRYVHPKTKETHGLTQEVNSLTYLLSSLQLFSVIIVKQSK